MDARRKGRLWATFLYLSVWAAGLVAPVSARAVPPENSRPNVLVILTDDQRADLMSVMPQTVQLFDEQGVTYSNAFANTPLCCPARASIFTGRFAHNHRVTANGLPAGFDHSVTIQRYLQEAGYRTGIVGKFFNQWDVSDNPPFFDRWAVTNELPTYNVDGAVVSVDEYATDYMANTAEQLIRDFEAQASTPWFLHVAPTAPHLPVSVAPEYQSVPVEPWQPAPSISKPPDPQITDGTRRMLMSVDDLVAQLFQTLEELGEADNTLAFFVSDNGFMWYEHNLWAKNKPYTESIEVPFLARWPGHLPAGQVEEDPVALVDMAPTILDAADHAPTSPMDGGSLLATSARTDMLTEAWRSTGTLAWASLRTTGYQYIEQFQSDGQTVKAREFYDLDEDPWQLVNLLAGRKGVGRPDVAALHARLSQAMSCSGNTECTSSLTSTSIEVHDATASEGAGQVAFDVSLSPAAQEDVQVPYAISEGTALSPADHAGGSGTLVISAGETSGQVSVPVVQDTLDEPDETLVIQLSSAVNGTVIQGAGTGTITDDDLPPAMVVSDASAGEADPGMTFGVTLSASSGKAITAQYSTGGGMATPGEDYAQTSGTLQIRAGQTSTTITVPLLADAVDEPDETFLVTLSGPSEASLADGEAAGTILDDDETPPPPTSPSITISDSWAGEGEPTMTFNVTLSGASSTQVSVAYATANGTGLAGKDYKRVLGTLKIPAGHTAGTITVPLLNDAVHEPDETFTLVLTDPKGATLADGEATGTILDDDPTP
jgi:arylsulfatase A-like enzyme